jgi:hypothetical protein
MGWLDDDFFATNGNKIVFNFQWLFSNNDPGNDHGTHFAFTGGFRNVRRLENGLVRTVHFGNYREFYPRINPNLGLAYELAKDFNWSWAERARWYVQGGADWFGYSSYSGFTTGLGAKAGLRFQTKSFGAVDLFVLGLF